MSGIFQYLRSFRHLTAQPESDGELLQRFRLQRDELAFATLVQRHGPMVLGIARRVMAESESTEDVFQATFLVLARRGRHLETWPSVAGWLLQVARRTALQARAKAARRSRHEQQAAALTPAISTCDPQLHACQRDLAELLDAELARLPSKYRTPLVLCQLHGQTREETARQLGWPVGSVSGRLARGKKLIQERLLRRGIVPSVVVGAVAMPRLEAQVPGLLVQATTLLASTVVHQSAKVSSSAAVALAQGVISSMFIRHLKWQLAAMIVATLCLGSAVWAWNSTGPSYQSERPVSQPEPLKGPFADILQGDWVVERTNTTELLSSHVYSLPSQLGVTPVDLPLHKRRFWKFAGNQVFLMDSWVHLLPVTQRIFTFVPYEIRPYEFDGRSTPYRIVISKLTGIIEYTNGRVNICVRPVNPGVPGSSPKQFEDDPASWNFTLRRANDYDRLEGIWRKEERNPVTDEIDTAEELIFKQKLYVRRQFRKNSSYERPPEMFLLNEMTNPKQLDMDIKTAAHMKETFAPRLRSDRNLPDFMRDYINNNQVLERRLGIYELKENELTCLMSGGIPFTLVNKEFVLNPQSPFNKRATSFAASEGISVTYKRVDRSLKDGNTTKMNPSDSTEPAGTDQKPPSSHLLDLRRQYLKVAQERMALWNEAYKTGRAAYVELGPISRQLLDANLALATDKEAKVKAMEEHLKVLRQIEQIMETRFRAGSSLRTELLGVQSQRIEFEIQLEELKAKK